MNWRLRKFIHDSWWRLMPGTVVKVQWPVGGYSADPNDHYRAWMEENVGRQCWDWDWDLRDDDCLTNRLSIKFRKGKESQAIDAVLRWS